MFSEIFEKKKQKKYREEFRKYFSWKWRMTNLWSDEFGPSKVLEKEPDELDWTVLIHHGPKQIVLRNMFLLCLFISLATLKVFDNIKCFLKFGGLFFAFLLFSHFTT